MTLLLVQTLVQYLESQVSMHVQPAQLHFTKLEVFVDRQQQSPCT